MNLQEQIFFEKLNSFINTKTLIKLTLTAKRDKTSDLKSIIVTLVNLKKGFSLSFVYRHNTKDITKNYNFEEGLDLVKKALESDFYSADIYSNTENINYTITPNGKYHLKTNEPTLQPITTFFHDRVKDRLISAEKNVYLRELGITNANWEIRREMSDKFKQINKYIELLEPYLNELSFSDQIHVADMGAGKGYLTFALYDFLTNNQKKNVKMTGVEYRDELVTTCNSIARKSNFDNLNFIQGTIEKTALDRIDILIALHACDTATDEAIYRGIKADASLIVCAPCCHKQIRKQFNVTNELHNVVKFGILKERQAEIITDSLRALIMEAHGYQTNVFEFISTEHTPKNVMIVGRKIRERNPDRQRLFDSIAAIKQLFGIEKHYLETLLEI